MALVPEGDHASMDDDLAAGNLLSLSGTLPTRRLKKRTALESRVAVVRAYMPARICI